MKSCPADRADHRKIIDSAPDFGHLTALPARPTIGDKRAYHSPGRHLPNRAGRGRTIGRLAGLAIAALLAGCTYSGPTDNILAQRLTWFSYLRGDDIRRACVPGAADRYRMIYNADFERQARGFDLVPAESGGAVLHQTVERGFVVGPDGRSLGELLNTERAETVLAPAEVDQLAGLLRESGAFDPPPVGLSLSSRSHYWLVVGCRDGRFFLTAFPDAQVEEPAFAPFLRDRDRTGVPWPAGADWAVGPIDPRCRRDGDDTGVCFTVRIGPDGLVGW